MYRSILLIFTLVIGFCPNVVSQTGSAKQVSWTTTSKKIGDKKYEIKLTATIAGNYHMYAQLAGVDGPVPTTISFTPNPLLLIQGKPIEQGKKITKLEEAWDGKVNFYEKTVSFVQTIQGKTKAKTNLNGKIEFMVCDDQLCLPPSVFTFKIPVGG